MSLMKNALDEILNCSHCVYAGWIFDSEDSQNDKPCECNPDAISYNEVMELQIEANEMLDLLSIRGTILETNLVELVDYNPSNRVVYATTRSWE